jgi:hypothetical protein
MSKTGTARPSCGANRSVLVAAAKRRLQGDHASPSGLAWVGGARKASASRTWMPSPPHWRGSPGRRPVASR